MNVERISTAVLLYQDLIKKSSAPCAPQGNDKNQYQMTCEPFVLRRRFIDTLYMNSTTSKAFLVIVMNCENRSQARKIAQLLRAFPYRDYGAADEPSISFSMMVKADSIGSIRAAIDPAIGKAKAAIGEMSFLSDNKISPEPFDFMRFKPPTRLRSAPSPPVGSNRKTP